MSINGMGLYVDEAAPDEVEGTVVLYGSPGSGKSLQAARFGPRILYVQATPDALRSAFTLRKAGEFPVDPPAHRITLDARTLPQWGGSMKLAIEAIIERFLGACTTGTCEYEGIAFDEWSALVDAVWEEFRADPWGISRAKDKVAINIFAVRDNFVAWHMRQLDLLRAARRLVLLVSHCQLPVFRDEAAEIQRYGPVKYPGGPEFPILVRGELLTLCANAAAVLQLAVEEPPAAAMPMLPAPAAAATPASDVPPGTQPAPKPLPMPMPAVRTAYATVDAPRSIYTQLDQQWFRKIRGRHLPARIEVKSASHGLPEILAAAGYGVPPGCILCL